MNTSTIADTCRSWSLFNVTVIDYSNLHDTVQGIATIRGQSVSLDLATENLGTESLEVFEKISNEIGFVLPMGIFSEPFGP
jgi:hypothetical protein